MDVKMSYFLDNIRNFEGDVHATRGVYKSSACKRIPTASMGKRLFGIFCFTTLLSLTWSVVEASIPTCLSLSAACMDYGLDCQQRLPHCFIAIKGHCSPLLSGATQVCSEECNEALQKLVDLPVSGWFTCDCTGMQFFQVTPSDCVDIQTNLVACSNYPTPASSTANSVVVARTPGSVTPYTTRPTTSTCSAAKIVCDEVASCRAALHNVLSVCDVSESAIGSDDACSMGCVKAMNKLEQQQTDAVQLWGCDCTEENARGRGDSPSSLPWCYVFSDSYLEKCVATEERHVTYGPLSSPKDSNEAGPLVGDDQGGNGTPSPRLYSPARWLYLVIGCLLTVLFYHTR